MTQNIYERKGYANRKEYLEFLADERGIDIEIVILLADTLGESEDFDGLISDLDDFSFIGLI